MTADARTVKPAPEHSAHEAEDESTGNIFPLFPEAAEPSKELSCCSILAYENFSINNNNCKTANTDCTTTE